MYRCRDDAFCIQKYIRTSISAGKSRKPDTDYCEAMSKNCYNNDLRFGGCKTARALNAYFIVLLDYGSSTRSFFS